MAAFTRRTALMGAASVIACGGLSRAHGTSTRHGGDAQMHAWTPDEFHQRRRHVALPQGDIAYVEAGHGPAVLFIHGWPLNGFQWRHVIARLAGQRRCIAPDLMGLGYSEVPERQGLAPSDQALMLSEFMKRLGVDSFDVISNDSGTAIAQLLAVAEPNRVRSLVMTNGDVHTNSPPEFLAPALEAAKKGELAAMFEAHLTDPAFATSPQGLGTICYENPATLSPEACDVYFRPLLADARRREQGQRYGVAFTPNPLPAIEDNLRDLRVPAHMVWGLADPIFDARWADWLDRTLPLSTGVTRLPSAKLFFPEERAQELADAALELWARK